MVNRAEKKPRRRHDPEFKVEKIKAFLAELRTNPHLKMGDFSGRFRVKDTQFRTWLNAHGGPLGWRGTIAQTIQAMGSTPAPSAPATSIEPSAGGPSAEWLNEQGAQLLLSIDESREQSAENDSEEEPDRDQSATLLSRPEPPESGESRESRRRKAHKEGGHIIRRPVPEAFASVEPETPSRPTGGSQADFMGKVNAEIMADNAALVRVMKIMARQ